MFSQVPQEEYLERYSDARCSVCAHVMEGAAVAAFGQAGNAWVAACNEHCLYDPHRLQLRGEHLIARQPEILALFHLPIGVYAVGSDRLWELRQLEVQPALSGLSHFVLVDSPLEEFLASNNDYYAITTGGELHDEVFVSGSRFVPFWLTEAHAKKYRKKKIFLGSLIAKVQKFSPASLVNASKAEGHNYICRETGLDKWICTIVNEKLNIEENTLI